MNALTLKAIGRDKKLFIKVTIPILFVTAFPFVAHSQGILTLSTRTARTYLGSTNGPLAGFGIWGQALVGFSSNSLSPLGVPIQHYTNGLVYGTEIPVPGTFPGNSVFAQMAAWDGTLWGTSFTEVPADQLGYTDIVLALLSSTTSPQNPTLFTLSAIVPQVPEPSSAVTILMFCGGAWIWRIRRRHRHRSEE